MYVCVGLRPKYSILVAVFGRTVCTYIHWYFVDVTSDPAILAVNNCSKVFSDLVLAKCYLSHFFVIEQQDLI